MFCRLIFEVVLCFLLFHELFKEKLVLVIVIQFVNFANFVNINLFMNFTQNYCLFALNLLYYLIILINHFQYDLLINFIDSNLINLIK